MLETLYKEALDRKKNPKEGSVSYTHLTLPTNSLV